MANPLRPVDGPWYGEAHGVAGRPVRLGLVIGQLGVGGAERQLYELVSRIDRTRFQCVVYCLSERTAPFGPMIQDAGAPVRVLRRGGHFDASRILRLALAMRRDRIDIAHSFLFLANAYAWAASRLARVPHLVTSARNCKDVGTTRRRINRRAFRASDIVVCNGEAVRSYVRRRYGAHPANTVVIYNGVDLTRFQPPVAAAPKTGPRERLVVTVGRLVPQKDLDLFLDAAALLARQDDAARFAIAGDGPSRLELERAAAARGLGRKVAFLGERRDVPAVLGAADVFWLTSAWEGLPNVVLEAMACGKPVIARAVGACPEIVSHGVSGFLVGERDPKKFADYTMELFVYPARAHAMGQAGREIATDRFSVARMVTDMENVYQTLAARDRVGMPRG
jgi:glycosyltransferase involved in cell wall biosynthesis